VESAVSGFWTKTMRPYPWQLVITSAAAVRALAFTNSHWKIWYAEPFVISWDDNSTAVDLDLVVGNVSPEDRLKSARKIASSYLLPRHIPAFFLSFLFFAFFYLMCVCVCVRERERERERDRL